ncbi:MAG: glutamyl-tRNA reductase [Cryomorphaceae bacterium]|nr:glutamyl-tRNA reductase [Cryomorphaceae bacterium]
MENLQVITITHKHVPLALIGKLHVDDEKRNSVLSTIKNALEISELAYLSTCNRVEFIISTPTYFCKGRQNQLLDAFKISGPDKATMLEGIVSYRGQAAFKHLLEVGASLDSMVIGEREIITQVRKAFDEAREGGLSGDFLRMVARKVIETSKKVYHETAIATKPVSVVSLAWHEFKAWGLKKDAPVLLIGSGQTNSNVARFLKKAGYVNVVVANRTFSNAVELATFGNWDACDLNTIPNREYQAIITCTASQTPILTNEMVETLGAKHISVIDLALPADAEAAVIENPIVRYVGMDVLQQRANKNLEIRAAELHNCHVIVEEAIADFEQLVRERDIEIAMRDIPSMIKTIRETAMGEVFAKELDQLDDASKDVLHKIIGYMEKKYISVPMKLAKQVILEKKSKN